MALGNFSATVDEWCREKGTNRLLKIVQTASQKLFSRSQSRVPVDTGFARASGRASRESMPQIDPSASKPKGGTNVRFDPGEIVLTIAGLRLGETLYFGYTANYAGELERGHSKQAPSGFVRVTAMEWQQIVSESVVEAKARVG